MIFTYFGIVLFLTWEWDKFIKERPVKQAIRPNQAGKHGIPSLVSGRGIQSSYCPGFN